MSNWLAHPLGPGGVVRHWLALGPVVTPLEGLEHVIDATGSPFGSEGRWTLNYWAWHPRVQATKARIYAAVAPGTAPAHGPHSTPGVAPGGPLAPLALRTSGTDPAWRYLAASDDLADFSRFSFTPTLFSGHLYVEIDCPIPGPRRAELLTIGPAHVWLDGRHVFSTPVSFGYVHAKVVPFTLDLKPGVNRLRLRGDMIGLREARLGLGLVLSPGPSGDGLQVRVPIGRSDPAAWRRTERDLEAVRVPRFDFGDDAPWGVLANGSEPCTLRVRFELPGEPASATPVTTLRLEPGVPFDLPITADLLAAHRATPGEVAIQVVFRPEDDVPIERRFDLLSGGVPYSHAPYGTYGSRCDEAVAHLAGVRGDVMGTLAAVRCGRARHLDSDAVLRAVSFMNERRDTADFFALSLMVLMFRSGDSNALVAADRDRIVEAFRRFKFWIDEPGLDAMCYFTENHQILFHVTEYLAGLYWPDMVFANSGRTGREKVPVVRERIGRWIRQRLRSGFSEWDSNAYLAMDAFALLALCDFSDDETLCEPAASLLDDLFLRLATQSFRGTHGSSHGRCYVAGLRSGRAEGTAGLQRIAWGMGTFNGETRATGMLAMSERYRVPALLQRIGTHMPAVLVTRARSHGAFRPEADLRDDVWDVRTLTRRTSATMLAAAVDQRPGALGIQEHLWQATLSPDAVVFTNHPGNLLSHGNARPNAWAGSARLPHVGMHERTVLCLYGLPGPRSPADRSSDLPDDRREQGPRMHGGDRVGLGFSHAYFPSSSFDDWQIEGNWAFARYGDGYLALWGDGPLALTLEGAFALHELRSGGPGQAWLCTVGSVAEDGAYDDFKSRLIAVPAPRVGGAYGIAPATPLRPDDRPVASPTSQSVPGVSAGRSRSDAHHGLTLRWRTPAGDEIALRWQHGLQVNGESIDSASFERYRNRYTGTSADGRTTLLRHEGDSLTIDLGTG